MGIVKDVLDIIKKLSEGLFNYLGGADMGDSNVTIDEKKIKKINDTSFEIPCTYHGLKAPLYYTMKINQKSDDLADIEIIYAEGDGKKSAKRNNVTKENFRKVSEKLLMDLLDSDTKLAYGIKSAKTMQVTLQRIVAAKETSINLTAIKANYDLGEAYTDLDMLLEAPEFTEAITEEPISFEIMDTGDDYDINNIEAFSDECTVYSLRNLLCAAVQFYMDIQLLHWECAGVQDLYYKIGSQLYGAQMWIDQLGTWIIERSNTVYNVLGDCKPDLGSDVDIICEHSPCIEILGLEKVFPVFDRMIDAIEWNLCNLPCDMQYEVAGWLRGLKHTRDFELKQI